MAEYIEREALNVAIHESWKSNPHNNKIAIQTHNHEHRHFLGLLHKQQSADVVAVRNGVWQEKGGDIFCSVCGIDNDAHGVERFNYCPNCGAKMDGKGEGE